MKPSRLAAIFAVVLAGALIAENVITATLTCPSSVNASSTNATAQTATTINNLFRSGPITWTLFATVSGTAAATNGTTTIYFARSYDGTTFEDAASSNVKLTLTPTGATAVTKADWFNLSGVYALRVGRVENTTLGNLTNITAKASFTPTGSTR